MKYFLQLNPLYFSAVKDKTKTIEVRPSKEENDRYAQMKAGDEIIFTNSETKEELGVIITFVHHYKDIKTLLEKESVKNVVPNINSLEKAMEMYNAIEGYKERIEKFGIYAIGVETI
ncbi:MAG TPA: DUF2110 family protein [Patescibacteria group bacterium]|nr:DUF2110 family protein [Patescibacteria group bacterium]